jgi:serine/threonine protein kinase
VIGVLSKPGQLQTMSRSGHRKKLKPSDFTMMEKIGEGSYGKVFRAVWKHYNAIVAIKIISLESDWLPLLAEVNMVIDLRHECIVNYYGWFFHEKDLWLVMEYCDSGSLSDVLDVLGHGLDEMQLSAVSRSVLSSLVYVHEKNRIHRDIKAGNLLVTSDGLVKLCDFGIAAQLDTNVVQRGTRIGSPFWMAPEVITGTGHNTKADIWSFGITVLELLTGAPPHFDLQMIDAMMQIQKGPPPQAPPKTTFLFRSFIQKILVKEPTMRPTAEELLMSPFILKCGDHSVDIIMDLVLQYRKRKEERKWAVKPIQPPESLTEADGEEDDEDDGDDQGLSFFNGMPEEGASTILYGTMVVSGTVKKSSKRSRSNPLATWTMQFMGESKKTKKFESAQKHNFANFSERDLRYLLDSVKNVAIKEMAEGKPRPVVLAHYNQVREGILKELQRKHPEIPNDFGAIS